jgi:osmoprotectant transport system permease protein
VIAVLALGTTWLAGAVDLLGQEALPPAEIPRIAIGSKNFSESRLLAEIFAQCLEADGAFRVDRRFNLAGTAICFRALRNGEIDLYPEYTGTGLVTLLGRAAEGSPSEVMASVRREFRERFDLEWLAPLGFENAYEVAVSSALAQKHGLRSIADLVPFDDELRFAFGYEFSEREDGLVGLRRAYGLDPRDLVQVQQTLKYEAAGRGRVDVIDVYTTDGLIEVHDLVVLEDPRGVFPPYEAAALVRGETLRRWPAVAVRLGRLSGLLDERAMRALNRRVEVDGEAVESTAVEFLRAQGLVVADPESGSGSDALHSTSSSGRRGRGLWRTLWEDRSELGRRTLEHLGLVFGALALSVLVAVPLGLWLERRRREAEHVIRAVGILQTIPSIALLAFMIPLLGVGARPAIAALFLYGLFPIVRNTFTGVRDADPDAARSARALGMTQRQVLRQVRLPLAVPVILAGVRTAAVISVGTATLAAFIGAGGLGAPIVAGLQLNDSTIILSGALPAAALALVVDGLLAWVERSLGPRGLV